MKFGICTSVDNAAAVRAAGGDFVEEGVQHLLAAHVPDEQWPGPTRVQASALPVPAANTLVPGALKITGPDAQLEALRKYMTTIFRRASATGTRMLVFGSGGARNVPEAFDRARARDQILEFLKMC